tara:strand:+ start:312 stop:1175 length:864 start_codon:yes stop_codon:yes gene_type:complete
MSNNETTEGFQGASGNQDTRKQKSQFIHLRAPAGTLNPYVNSGTTNVPFSAKGPQTVMQQFNAAVEKTSFVGRLPLKGPYVAVVLKVENNYMDPQPSEENWAERSQSAAQGEVAPLFSIRARIPELHANIPMPITFPKDLSDQDFSKEFDKLKKNGEDYCGKKEQIIIDMHPLFTCMGGLETETIPQIGSLVWVDFIQGPLGLGGVYIGPFGTTKMSVRSNRLNSSGLSAHQPDNSLQASSGASAASGQSESAQPSEDSQVAKPKVIPKENSTSKKLASFGNWEDVL